MRIFQKLFWISFLFLSVVQGAYSYPQQKSVKCKEPPPHCTQRGDWFTRLCALYFLPNDSSNSFDTIAGSKVGVHPSWTGEFDFGVMFTDYLGLELMLATARETLVGKGSLAGTEIGTTWLFPPTLTVQWRMLIDYCVQPYVGAGANYTIFYGNTSSLANTNLTLGHSWGPAVQGGVDWFFYKDWIFNLDVKYIWIGTEVNLSGETSGRAHMDVNPWIFGFGFGRKW